jgi:hypothetical protein
MKTATAETSIRRYHALLADGEVTRIQAQILSVMETGKAYTRAELSQATGLMINTVTGRVYELVQDGRIEESPARHCGITGYTAKTVRLSVSEGA